MAAAVIDRAWRDAEPDAIEPALAALWREVGRRLPSAHAVMSNLVVVRGCGSDEEFEDRGFPRDLPLDEVVARHPSRVIIVAHEEGCAVARAPMAARVGVSTFGPPAARYGVEIIAVRAACGEASMASIVRRLVRGDVPTSVWWTDDLSRATPPTSIVAGARQLIYDSRPWAEVASGVRTLERIASEDPHLDFADVNWRRLAPVRNALLHVAGALSSDELHPTRVRIAHGRGDMALAWLLGGWLSARLGWGARGVARIEEMPSAERGSVLTLEIGAPAAQTRIELAADRIIVTPRDRPPYIAAIARETPAEGVAAELRTLAPDLSLREAIAGAARAQR